MLNNIVSKGRRKEKNEQGYFEAIKDKSVEEALGIYLKGNAGTPKKIALRQLLEELADEIMKGERSIFLNADPNNKGNGYYLRDLTTGSWRLNVNVSRDRKGNFRP